MCLFYISKPECVCVCLLTADSWGDEQGTEVLQEPWRSWMQWERQTQDQGVHQEVHAEVWLCVPTQGRHRAGLTNLKQLQESPGSSFQPNTPGLNSFGASGQGGSSASPVVLFHWPSNHVVNAALGGGIAWAVPHGGRFLWWDKLLRY